MPVRSQATNQRPADRTSRPGDQNFHRGSLSALQRFEAGRVTLRLQARNASSRPFCAKTFSQFDQLPDRL
jgi:hypothetical protein